MVSGSLRATDTLYSTTAQFNILRAPTTSGGTTFGPGTANNLLKSNGTSVYWSALAASDIPNLAASKITSGTFDTARIPTNISITGSSASCTGNAATATKATQATKDGDGNTISSTYLKLIGGTMTGALKTSSDIVQTAGYIRGTDESYLHHGIKLGHSITDAEMNFYEVGGTFNFYKRTNETNIPLLQIRDGASDAPLRLDNGGTGATTAADARANLDLNDIGTLQAQSAITPVNDNQVHNITISADCWVCVSLHVTANTDGSASVWRNGIPVINNAHTNGACNYWANAQFPCKAGGLLQYMISSNATDSYISFLTV